MHYVYKETFNNNKNIIWQIFINATVAFMKILSPMVGRQTTEELTLI